MDGGGDLGDWHRRRRLLLMHRTRTARGGGQGASSAPSARWSARGLGLWSGMRMIAEFLLAQVLAGEIRSLDG